jgi:hypothetical protein
MSGATEVCPRKRQLSKELENIKEDSYNADILCGYYTARVTERK